MEIEDEVDEFLYGGTTANQGGNSGSTAAEDISDTDQQGDQDAPYEPPEVDSPYEPPDDDVDADGGRPKSVSAEETNEDDEEADDDSDDDIEIVLDTAAPAPPQSGLQGHRGNDQVHMQHALSAPQSVPQAQSTSAVITATEKPNPVTRVISKITQPLQRTDGTLAPEPTATSNPPSAVSLDPTPSTYDIDLDTILDKPWTRPGADITDYFNYGFNEVIWKAYVEKQKGIRKDITSTEGQVETYNQNGKRPRELEDGGLDGMNDERFAQGPYGDFGPMGPMGHMYPPPDFPPFPPEHMGGPPFDMYHRRGMPPGPPMRRGPPPPSAYRYPRGYEG
ncbi:Fip1 motif-domain-containing protein [Gaertneriomyces semiglobifer]|nr:Fip1 motif-domain-containing protein [Gaertneriomyces semiglobifer]